MADFALMAFYLASAITFVGFPTLLVTMAWITRDRSSGAVVNRAARTPHGHASGARAHRRAALALAAIPAAVVIPSSPAGAA